MSGNNRNNYRGNVNRNNRRRRRRRSDKSIANRFNGSIFLVLACSALVLFVVFGIMMLTKGKAAGDSNEEHKNVIANNQIGETWEIDIKETQSTLSQYSKVSKTEAESATEAASENATEAETQVETEAETEAESKEPETAAETNPVNDIEVVPAGYTGKYDYEAIFSNDCFIGDSRTNGLFMNTQLMNPTFLYATGLHISEAPYYDEIISGLSSGTFRRVFIQLGVNDLGYGSAVAEYEGMVALIELVREKQPGATIYVESVIPVTQTESDTSDMNTLQHVEEVNGFVRNAANDAGAVYVDIVPYLCGGVRVLPENAAVDGVHLTRAYCYRWLDYFVESL